MLGHESLLTGDYRIEGESLYRYRRNTVERIVAWGRDAGAWRLTAGVWQVFVPEIDLPSIEQTASEARHSPAWRRRAAACRFLVERWPEPARAAVRRFPTGHWQLLAFVNAGETAALELLQSNPALGYLAAMAGAAGQLGLRRRTLAALLGFPETEHAVRLLRKVPAAWISAEFLMQLRAAIREDPEADSVLTHLARVNPLALEVARDPALRVSVAPECIGRLSRTQASLSQCDLLERLRDVVSRARALALAVPRIRSVADLDRPIAAAPAAPTPARPPVNLIFPEPPLPDLDTEDVRIRAIRTRHELVAESGIMDHCAGRQQSYARRVEAGRLYFYRMLKPERLTIAIRPNSDGWMVEDVRGFRNRQPLENSARLIRQWLRGPGRSPIVLRIAAPRPRRRFQAPDQLSFEFAKES